ncbi:Vps36-domain-containing protein, partial [Aureobasidium melanogenum]
LFWAQEAGATNPLPRPPTMRSPITTYSQFCSRALVVLYDSVGLYEGKYKIPNYQNGHAYLTSHRVCYVDNQEPRKFSIAIDLKDVDRQEFYAGFLKSSAKITLYPKAPKHNALAIRSPKPGYPSPSSSLGSTPPSRYSTPGRVAAPSPAPVRDPNATWICPICSFANPVPSNFDPSTANDRTPLAPCLACGIKPPLVHVVKAAIAALSNRPSGSSFAPTSAPTTNGPVLSSPQSMQTAVDVSLNQCPRCTFSNHPSLGSCEICGAKLSSSANRRSQIIESAITRPESPGPSLPSSVLGETVPESVKLSFRAGGDKIFYERLKDPTPESRTTLQRRRAFEDLEALMTSAKEVIAMAERFRSQNSNGGDSENDANAEAASLLSDMGLVTTKDMLSGSGADRTYIAELSRNLAEFLTDDKRGVLRREGGIMSLVDLWALPCGIHYAFPSASAASEAVYSSSKAATAPTTKQSISNMGLASLRPWKELEMAEERGALCREQGLDGVRFWENFFADIPVKLPKAKTTAQLEQLEIERRLKESGLL